MKIKTARFISNVLSPFIVGPITVLLVLLKNNSLSYALFLTCITSLLIIGPVLIYLLIQIKRGVIKDIFVSNKKQRTPIYFIALGSIVLTFFVLNQLTAPLNLFLSLIAVLLTFIACVVINKFTKISLHTSTIFGATVILYFVYDVYIFIIGSILTIIVAWARIITKSHEVKQIILGVLVSGILTSLVFTMFG